MAGSEEDGAADLREVVKAARLRPMNFAMAPGKGPVPVVLLAHKLLDSARLAEKVKRQGVETARLVHGVMRVEGARLVLQTDGKVQPQLLRALKLMLQAQKLQLKPVAAGAAEEE